ncbi:dihydrofolate reductase [Prevotella sp. PMUR]|uniref:Dihydrofolate reductase n=2 Tax=Xylanibacter muris TaxID=2736290 RepID=A0ABX2ARF1_9BACT|nr:dihydrofolate reductase [Xylanibacter muris]NPD93122.1 dihydrofolate reductase [Xylanibacter muris]
MFCFGERFADIQMLRYKLNGFDKLSARQKLYIYYLSKATLYGRDITFDQFGKYNLRIRKMLEAVFVSPAVIRDTKEFNALEEYLKRVWFSNGIYHHYGCQKFKPGFSREYLRSCLEAVSSDSLPLKKGETLDEMCDELFHVIFDEEYMSKRVNKSEGCDLVVTSACNYYENVTQEEAEEFYRSMKKPDDDSPVSYGLNSRLVKSSGLLEEQVWKVGGMYSEAIEKIVYWLGKAAEVTENEKQHTVISKLIKFYRTGSLEDFDDYSIEWVGALEGDIDFINGFIEVYGDPLGLKGSWEGIVEYKDAEATKRTDIICSNAQWFEDHSPVNPKFRKTKVRGVTASVICAAMLGGDEYPSTAIGINLPNADWIRSRYGSKSVTIGNLTEAYNMAAKGSGFRQEFVSDEGVLELLDKYGDICDELHTDLHECLGHGSGRLLPGVDPDSLKSYGSTIEEARADLFALYYMADVKMVELGLLPDMEAYKAEYYSYMMNGLMTQLVRINIGDIIEEDHMRNRALVANWCMAHGDVLRIVKREGKSYVEIKDYDKLHVLIGKLLWEIQRIKSEGDFEAARSLVERYAVNIDAGLHAEIVGRYEQLNIAPYKGFLNPWMKPVYDEAGEITDIELDYSEDMSHQMLRYSREYSTL